MTSDDEGQLTKAFKFRPSRQAIITDLAAQAVFRPDEVVPYPASLVRAKYQSRGRIPIDQGC